MHNLTKRFNLVFLLCVLLCTQSFAEMISKISVQGNKRVPESSIIAFSELAVGIDVDQQDIKNAIRAIYQKGLFDNVSITIKQSVVTIKVKERPIIRKVDIKKNKMIPEEGLNEILKKNNLESGEVLNPMKLNQFKHQLLVEHRLNGYPDVTVSIKTVKVNESMVDIQVTIMKGSQYQVRRINVAGNLAFTDRVLLSRMSLGTPSLYARLFGGNYYSKLAFEKSKADLKSFYMDEGFLKFAIDEVTVTKVPNTKSVDIQISVNEGPRYMFANIKIDGDQEAKQIPVEKVISLQRGISRGTKFPFARKQLFLLTEEVTRALEKRGYPLKTVEPSVDINEKDATVNVTFKVKRGVPVIIRSIEFSGNTLTMDRVLRREVAISEGEMYTETGVQESIRRLSNLGYLKNVRPEVSLADNNPREVDIVFNVEDAPEATANLEMGVNQTDYVVFTASIKHPNFGGTGNNVDLKFEKSRVRTTVSILGDAPFVLRNGLGVGYKIYYEDKKNSSDNTAMSKYTWMQSYSAEKIGFNLSASAPISLYQNLAMTAEISKNNYGYDPNDPQVPDNVVQSIDRYGNNLWNLISTARWTRNTLDRAVLPSSGNKEEVSIKIGAPLNESFTSYITMDSRISLFKKLGSWPITFNPAARFGIGQGFKGFTNITGCIAGKSNDDSCNTELPFDEKFYSTPTSPVRGVMTFGEKVNGRAIGGDLITTASMNVFLKPFNDDQVIPSLFVDGGYAFNDHAFDFGKWVYSAGLQFRVMTPIAPILLVFSYPLKIDDDSSEYGEDTFRYAQFSMQANLY